jgi:FlaA1/EpsC-like NDP-sugar epimerase
LCLVVSLNIGNPVKDLPEMLIIGSPLYASGHATVVAFEKEFWRADRLQHSYIAFLAWIIAFVTLTLLLMLYNLLTFNYFMGRMSQGWLLRAEQIWASRVTAAATRLRFWRRKEKREKRSASADL